MYSFASYGFIRSFIQDISIRIATVVYIVHETHVQADEDTPVLPLKELVGAVVPLPLDRPLRL